jgi:cobalt/nickel transport system permease protein
VHISEGFLSPPVLAAGWAIACTGVAFGLKKTSPEGIVRVAMASSVFFLASLINIKIGPSSTHLSLTGAVGLLLGWTSFPAILTALLLQAVLFQFGGLLVLGANTVSMALPAVCAYLLFGPVVRHGGDKAAAAASFAAGMSAVLLGAAITAAWLFLSDRNMVLAAKTIFLAHLPLSLAEGTATLFMILFLKRTFPDMLRAAEGS